MRTVVPPPLKVKASIVKLKRPRVATPAPPEPPRIPAQQPPVATHLRPKKRKLGPPVIPAKLPKLPKPPFGTPKTPEIFDPERARYYLATNPDRDLRFEDGSRIPFENGIFATSNAVTMLYMHRYSGIRTGIKEISRVEYEKAR